MALLLQRPSLANLFLKNPSSAKPISISTPIFLSNTQTRRKPLNLIERERPKRGGVLRNCSANARIGFDASVEVDENVLVPEEDEEGKGGDVVEYDWREEWYPLYLTEQVPDDSPLGLTVFDKQIVLYRDGNGLLSCYEDRCPHRLAKLSEGQLIDGRLECLYHGWQFDEDGKCIKIPQLPKGARIPHSACVRTYEVRDSQGVVWVWMADKNKADANKLPWFEHFARPGFQAVSSIHELPYDHSILLENLMDPAHVPISHDRTDWSAKREDAQPLAFKVTEHTNRGFAGFWGRAKDPVLRSFLRFEAPCVLQYKGEIDKNGEKQYFSSVFLCRPTGQGKSMVIMRFGASTRPFLFKLVPSWYYHQNASKVLEQDKGFLASQNEVLMKEKVPTKGLYLNLRSSDTWVAEYRKWMDKVGHGMPYYIGQNTISLPKDPAVVEHTPAGLIAGISASMPAKGGFGTMHVPNPTNRYFRHIVHCKGCRNAVKAFQAWKNMLSILSVASAALAVLASARQWKVLLLALATVFLAGAYAFASLVSLNTTNFIRKHRRL